ncbi:peptidyl-tRNA hydrolase [Verruconis gallopava]|uniref:peptidyl-tRNA hydrolase n=1 Tax=Verruconis gallopava TaxID=253628 RepID=A0A0D2B5H6_9PEZI|nr:peptidyl-tRNA hydrolase [Verruconis gallopava]KIW06464.1 peptidyl-tRNA hydrolase [Verruconis gallopava]
MANLAELRKPLAYVLLGVLTGFFLGRISATTISPANALHTPTKAGKAKAEDSIESDSEGEGDEQGELGDFKGSNEECKLVLVVRTDLGMTKGKIAAQCSHATLACYKALKAANSPILTRWERMGQAKVTVQAKSEDELLLLQAQAVSLGLCARIIHDAGRTQIASGSATVLGVGPGPRSVVDAVTGGLKLL